MSEKDTITIYWSSASFSTEDPSWDLVYPSPESVFSKLVTSNTQLGIMPKCPAVKNLLKNTFCFESAITDVFDLPSDFMAEIAYTEEEHVHIPAQARLRVAKMRKTSYEGFINLSYNMSWLFFADEPLEVKFTAPYFPNVSPVPGALLSPGIFDIGRWFRPFKLDYHVPLSAKKFEVNEGDALFYLEALTEKKVVFKRYVMSPRLSNIMTEGSESPIRYGQNASLEKRYSMGDKSELSTRVLNEIKKNLV
jgi:hypothetical protein